MPDKARGSARTVETLSDVTPEGGTPSPPAFDSKIFLINDLDSNLDTQSIRFDISVVWMRPKDCALACCRCICSCPHAYGQKVRQASGPVPVRLGHDPFDRLRAGS